MKHNYKELLDNNLSVNSYLWPNDRNPFQFIETIVKSGIKNIGLHTDFINLVTRTNRHIISELRSVPSGRGGAGPRGHASFRYL